MSWLLPLLRRPFLPLFLTLFAVGLLEPALDGSIRALHAQSRKQSAQKGKGSAKNAPAKKKGGKKEVAAKPSKGTAKKGASAMTASAKKGASGKKMAKEETRRGKDRKKRTSAPRVVERKPKVETPARRVIPVSEQVLADTTFVEELADGIAHRWVKTNSNQVANVVTIDLKSGARLKSYKAHNRCDGLQNACDIGKLACEELKDTVLAVANASFWRAGTNTPIGATVTGGEVVELPGYKLWSSLMIFEDGSAAIDRISLRGELFWRSRRFQVAGVNRRGESNGIVVYNGFYGDSLPRGSRKSDSAIIAEAVANKVDHSSDNTESSTIDTAFTIRSYRDARLLEDKEHAILKIACIPVPPRRKRDTPKGPSIGDTMRLIVTKVDTGVVEMPERGYVISLGEVAESFAVVQVGDTVGLLYMITPEQPKRVREVLTGTPRIVRDGVADPEYEVEGSKARRFIDGKLARTAVGISRDGDTLILATISSGSQSEDRTGMSLEQLAAFMRSVGAYQAINFDGGGSASMAVNGVMISRQGNQPTTRRVSNALVVVKPVQTNRRPRRAGGTE